VPPQIVARPTDRQRLEVSTVMKAGDREVVRTQPFVHVSMALGAGYTITRDYPEFDAQAIFAADDSDEQVANTGLIYGAKVENEVSLRTIDFPLETATFDTKTGMSADEVEKVVRNTAAILTDGDVELASLHYVDPQRFGETLSTQALAAYGVKIVQENVTVSPGDADETAAEFAEDLIVFNADKPIVEALAGAGYDGPDAEGMAEAIGKLMNATALKAGTVLRLGIETHGGEESRIVRASVYAGEDHLLTIALNDEEQYVPAQQPEPNPELMAAYENAPPPRVRSELPRIYDGIYRAAYSYGLTPELAKQVIKVLASDVDYQSRLSPSDRLEVFFSQPGPDNKATEDSQLLFVKATIGSLTKAYYPFRTKDGTVDYFDPEGKSARQFLIRNPMPGARLSRGYGMQRHPILGYRRMHTGDDWAIARGTPIRAAGSGVVEKAGWDGGYGRHTVIKHANGFSTVYGHQSAIAKGIEPGVHVRQGQIIGYVGSTGLSTGPHLHFEIRVNGKPVDPLRVRLPDGKALKGPELQAFTRERNRIDALLKDKQRGDMTVAAAAEQ
jgi:murein DD-endopeptidase MepM/ murein hydrolase activator NlpD